MRRLVDDDNADSDADADADPDPDDCDDDDPWTLPLSWGFEADPAAARRLGDSWKP